MKGRGDIQILPRLPSTSARDATIRALIVAHLRPYAERLWVRRSREDIKRAALHVAHLVYWGRATRQQMDALAAVIELAEDEGALTMVSRSLATQWAAHERRFGSTARAA